MQPNPLSVKMDDSPIDALDLGRIAYPTKQLAELLDTFIDGYARLTHARTVFLDGKHTVRNRSK
jgi:hypothetical protein